MSKVCIGDPIESIPTTMLMFTSELMEWSDVVISFGGRRYKVIAIHYDELMLEEVGHDGD